MHWKSLPFIVAATALAPAAAFAHASLVAAFPENGAIISSDNLAIELHFNSRVDSKLSRMTLVKPNEGGVVLPLEAIPAQDELKAEASNLPPGAYNLHWQTLSVDGHLTQGEIKFRVER